MSTYTYEAAGNRTSKTDKRTNVTSTFNYDPLYELTQVQQGATTTESYGYDAVGNRLSSVGVASYTYNSSNELTSNSNATYTYDNNGNTLTKVDSTGTTTYTWDYENRLTKVVLPGSGGTITFKYDPFGRRIQKSGPSGTTNYIYDGANILEEVDQNGNVLAKYTQGGGIDQPLAEVRSGTTSYYQQDALSSVTSLSNSAGALANTYTYDSYGKLTASSGSVTNPFQYTGRELDPETGIYGYRALYYDPNVARFISEDPARLQGGIDFYAYVRNSPVSLADPLGLCPPKNEAPENPCQYAGGNPDPSFWAAMGADARWDPFIFYEDVRYGFAIGGYLDAQPSGRGSPYDRAAYGNYVFGAYMAAAGLSLQDALAGANDVAWWHSINNPSQYAKRNKDSNFPALPVANVLNITAGYNAEVNGTLCQK